MDIILNTKQVAERLGIHINTVYGYLASGKLEEHKLGGNSNSKRHWRIRERDLEAFVDGQGVGLSHSDSNIKSEGQQS